MTPAVKSYLLKYKFKKVAFFCTFGSGVTNTFKDMEELSKKPVATLGLWDRKIGSAEKKIREFCRCLNAKTI